MRIYIPTYGRPDNQKTYNLLPQHIKKKTWFVIRPEEKKCFNWAKNVVVCNKKGVPAARQAALDHSSDNVVILLDDDLRFSRRQKDWNIDKKKTSILKASEKDAEEALVWMDCKIRGGRPMAGLSGRGNNNSIEQRWERECHRLMYAFAVNKKLMTNHGIRFDRFKFWEDFHVNLSFLKLGMATVANVDIVIDAVTNSPGGVSLYRTREALVKERERFMKFHSPFVRPTEKSAKNWGGTVSATMPDVQIYWRKAYAHGVRNSSGR